MRLQSHVSQKQNEPSMAFLFQQPGSALLLKAIDTFADNADEGGGIFAFASRDGVHTLLTAPQVARHLQNKKSFRLVVGVDATTNAAALLRLGEALAQFPNVLSAQVFFHEHTASTFHPKFCWFKKGGELRLITGSGNLTSRGLGLESNLNPAPGNWEAFTTQILSGNEAKAGWKVIDDWFAAQQRAGTLCKIDDPRVQGKAMENGRVRYAQGAKSTSAAKPRRRVTPAIAIITATQQSKDMLVRELPRNRHGQADIGQAAMAFFGFEGAHKEILIQHVSLDGTLGPVKHTPLFVNKSHNYRLELDAIGPLRYEIAPDDGRMILVATRLDEQSFRYTIVPITAADYSTVSALLGPIPAQGARSRPMREGRFTADDIKDRWPNAPEALLPVELGTGEP